MATAWPERPGADRPASDSVVGTTGAMANPTRSSPPMAPAASGAMTAVSSPVAASSPAVEHHATLSEAA